MKDNVDRVLERDTKLASLDERAGMTVVEELKSCFTWGIQAHATNIMQNSLYSRKTSVKWNIPGLRHPYYRSLP